MNELSDSLLWIERKRNVANGRTANKPMPSRTKRDAHHRRVPEM
jgi:hypothetical protein